MREQGPLSERRRLRRIVDDVDKTAFVAMAREKIWPQFEKQYGKDMQAIYVLTR